MKTIVEERKDTGPDALRLYLRDISRIPQLTVDEEREIALRVRAGDEAARRKLVESNLRFVVSMARKYARSGYPMSELVNEGNVGLIEAAARFDPARGVRFITYAGWWVRQAMLAAIAHHGQSFRIPPKLKHELYQFETGIARLTQDLGRRPNVEEIAQGLEMKEADVRAMFDAVPREVSLSQSVDDSGEIRIEDLVEDAAAPSADEVLEQQTVEVELERLLELLSDKERGVVERRFGLGDSEPETLAEIGADLDLSRERIRQIEQRALDKMRLSERGRLLAGYLN